MDNRISLKIRLLGAFLHLLSGSITASIVLLITMLGFSYNRIISDLLVFTPILIPATVFLSPVLILVLWVQTRDIHPFINQSGRDAINCLLSALIGLLLSILFTVFIFSITCGIGSSDATPFLFSFIPLGLVTTTYFCNSIVATIFAIQGYRLNNRLIYPFIRPL